MLERVCGVSNLGCLNRLFVVIRSKMQFALLPHCGKIYFASNFKTVDFESLILAFGNTTHQLVASVNPTAQLHMDRGLLSRGMQNHDKA